MKNDTTFYVDASTDIITTVCKHLGFKNFITGLHNALSHGKLLDACDISYDDEELYCLFEALIPFINTVNELQD